MELVDWLLGTPAPVLKGETVRLRTPRGRDFREWRALREASRDFLVPWEPQWAPDELTRKAYMARLARYRRDARERRGFSFFLFDEPTGRLCGGITLSQIRRGVSQTGAIGYWMGEAYAGQGRMAEALRLVCSFAFEVERLHRVEAACLPRNARSIALLEKSGFTYEGHLRKYLMIGSVWEDHRLYSLLVDDLAWAAQRLPDRRTAFERRAHSLTHG